MRFEEPLALLLLAVIPALVWWRRGRGGDAALRFSSAEPACEIGRSLRARLASLPFWLSLAALCLLIAALARPQTGGRRTRQPGRGLAIEFVIDRSGSMDGAMWYRGRQLNRLEVAKRVLQEFVKGDGEKLKGRGSDLIGIIGFAFRPETVCPLTLAHDSFAGILAGMPIAEGKNRNGTAIGDAIALAAARLREASPDIKSKLIVLLTDGENTAGVRTVWQGGQIAAKWGIRVHAIGITGAPPPQKAATNRYTMQMRYVSERDLGQVAKMCSGVYRNAQDGEALESIYREIDRLEKSELAATRYVDGEDRAELFLILAVTLLASATLLSNTWLRRIP